MRIHLALLPVALAIGCRDTTAPLPATAFVRLGAGGFHTCAVRASGDTFCWGDDGFTQLGRGVGTFDSSLVPALVVGGHRFVRVDGGDTYTCGLEADGRAYCWGLGMMTADEQGAQYNPSPVAVAGGLVFSALGASLGRTCALISSGITYCWPGPNSYLPEQVGGSVRLAKLGNGDNGTCGVTSAGAAYCSGDNNFGELGNPAGTDATSPVYPFVAVAGGLTWDTVAMGNLHVCGIAIGGAVYCWGDNAVGEIGADTSVRWSGSPVPLPGGLRFRRISTGSHHTCGLTTGGDAYCWGYNYFGQLGAPTTELCYGLGTPTAVPCSHVPVRVAGNQRFVTIDAGDFHTCGLTASGEVWCWGSNLRGQLGDGTLSDRAVPTPISSSSTSPAPTLARGAATRGVATRQPAWAFARWQHAKYRSSEGNFAY